MQGNYYLVKLLIGLLLCSSCKPVAKRTIALQPFEAFPLHITDTLQQVLHSAYGSKVVVLSPKKLPQSAFVRIKSPRYRADSLLRFLRRTKPDTIDYTLGLTTRDISTTKRDSEGNILAPVERYTDWGVFGLGYRPGPSCVVSTFRIHGSDKAQFIERLSKICVHEIGHNLGLPHCQSSEKCVMRDAAETIKTIDQVNIGLCKSCRLRLY